MIKKIKQWNRIQKIQAAILAVALLVSAILTLLLTRWIVTLQNPDTHLWFQQVVAALGPVGWIVLFIVQFLQVVLAFVPGGPIQIIAGILYGPLLGLAICFAGDLAATAAIYALVHKFGHKVVELFVTQAELEKYKFLHDEKKVTFLVLLLYFIPGTPKDALTYLFALTPLSMKKFIVLSSLARLPAVLTSVIAGDYIMEGNWLMVAFIFALLAAFAVVGFIIQQKVVHRMEKPQK